MKIGEKYKTREGKIVTIQDVVYTAAGENGTITLYGPHLKPYGNPDAFESDLDLMERVEWRQK